MPNNLTIGIPTYNNNKSLKELLQWLGSVIKSSDSLAESEIEVLIVADGSKVPNKYSSLCPNCQILKHPKNRGLAAARNTIIANADSNLILQLDDDCFPSSTMLDEHWEYHQQNPENQKGCVSKFEWHPEQKQNTFMKLMGPVGGPTWNPNEYHTTPYKFYSSSLSFKRNLVIENNFYFDENFIKWGCEDTEWSKRLWDLGIRFGCLVASICYHKTFFEWKDYASRVSRAAENILYFYAKYPDDKYLQRWVSKGLGYNEKHEKTYKDIYHKMDILLEQASNSEDITLFKKNFTILQAYYYSISLAQAFLKLPNYTSIIPTKLFNIGTQHLEEQRLNANDVQI